MRQVPVNEAAKAEPEGGPDNQDAKRRPRRAWIAGLALMGVAAFFIGRTELVRGLVAGGLSEEEQADLGSPRLIEARAFSFRYPGNWILDRSAADFDPERYLLIESPGGAMVIIMVLDGPLDPEALLENQLRDFEDSGLKVETRTSFYEWGRIEGRGTLLAGRILGVAPGVVRIFVGRNATRTLLFVSQVDNEDRGLVEPGLELIADSFVLREGAAPDGEGRR